MKESPTALVSFIVSAAALLLSGAVAWMTLIRRGKLHMTRPAFVAFCYDRVAEQAPMPKIFVRSLLYSSGKRGHVIENMFLVVRIAGRSHHFNVWGHGDGPALSRGSGLFVPETGIVTNHHFNPHDDFEYVPGDYELELFATLPGRHTPVRLQTIAVSVNDAQRPSGPHMSIWFDWQPDQGRYRTELQVRRPDWS